VSTSPGERRTTTGAGGGALDAAAAGGGAGGTLPRLHPAANAGAASASATHADAANARALRAGDRTPFLAPNVRMPSIVHAKASSATGRWHATG
jgi:hypothetical protein